MANLSEATVIVLSMVVFLGVIMIIQGSVAIAAYNDKTGQNTSSTATTLRNVQIGFLVVGIATLLIAVGFGVYTVRKTPVFALPSKISTSGSYKPPTTIDI